MAVQNVISSISKLQEHRDSDGFENSKVASGMEFSEHFFSKNISGWLLLFRKIFLFSKFLKIHWVIESTADVISRNITYNLKMQLQGI